MLLGLFRVDHSSPNLKRQILHHNHVCECLRPYAICRLWTLKPAKNRRTLGSQRILFSIFFRGIVLAIRGAGGARVFIDDFVESVFIV